MLNRLLVYFALLACSTAVYISPGNHVILAGRNATFECSSSYAPPYWHFYSLTPGSRPCGFGSYRLYSGISRCPSAARISVTYPSTYRNRSTLTISRAQLSDAGTYTCGGRNPYYRSMTLSAIVGVIASYPTISSVTDGCKVQDQNASLVCNVTYNGTSLMPLRMTWHFLLPVSNYRYYLFLDDHETSNSNVSSVHHSLWTFTVTEQETDRIYWCSISFSSPTGLVIPRVQKQSSNRIYNRFWSSPFIPRTVADCAAQITFSVNGQRSVDTGASLTVGDVITCSAEDALSYRWTNLHNDSDEATYGKTISVSQPGNFNYQCTVFLDCGTDGAVCPFSKNISGLAREFVTAAPNTTMVAEVGFQNENTPETYKSATIALGVLLVIILVGIIVLVAVLLHRSYAPKPSVPSSSGETNRSELDVHQETENQYINTVAAAAEKHDQAVYQDLNIGAASAEPIVYETIKPRAQPKPRRHAESNA